jgi:CRISPR system Cascade subunit CasA
MSEHPTFSLLTEPWISCERGDGTDALLSLREVFDGSTEVVGLRGDSPTQDYAVLRVLLAIFWRARRPETVPGPGETFYFDDWREDRFAETSEPDEAVLTYLDAHADRFDLLHPTQPFMQVADLRTSKDSRLEVSRIIPEAESSFFTMRAGEGLTSLSFAEAARWLIHTQAYDYSGIKSGAVGDPRVKGGKGYPIGTGWTGMTGGTTVLGRTLRETLLLNTPSNALREAERDLPIWERSPDGPAPRAVPDPAGPADLATWQSRRIRLFTEGTRVTAVLVSNGDRIPEAGANILKDPMTPYRFSANKSTKVQDVFYPRPYDTNRMMWRSLEPLLALDGDVPLTGSARPGKRPLTLNELAEAQGPFGSNLSVLNLRLTSASYGPQASAAATTVDARIDIPRALLHASHSSARRAVLDNASATFEAAKALGIFGGRLLVAAGGEYAFDAKATDSLLAGLEPEFRAWLRRLDPNSTETAGPAWQRLVAERVRSMAQVLLRGAGAKALIGREVVNGEHSSFMTAGTAYAHLQRDLRKNLPLLAEPKNTTTHATGPSEEETTHD